MVLGGSRGGDGRVNSISRLTGGGRSFGRFDDARKDLNITTRTEVVGCQVSFSPDLSDKRTFFVPSSLPSSSNQVIPTPLLMMKGAYQVDVQSSNKRNQDHVLAPDGLDGRKHQKELSEDDRSSFPPPRDPNSLLVFLPFGVEERRGGEREGRRTPGGKS